MGTVTFEGTIIVPSTDIKHYAINPNEDVEIQVADMDIVVHAIYVSHQEPNAIVLTIRPKILSDKELEFGGVFLNNATPLRFDPPIGVFKQGKLVLRADSLSGLNKVHVSIQYSPAVEEVI